MRNKGKDDLLREAAESIARLERELNEAYRALSDISSLDAIRFVETDMYLYAAPPEEGFIGHLHLDTMFAIDRARSKPRWPT